MVDTTTVGIYLKLTQSGRWARSMCPRDSAESSEEKSCKP